MIPSRTVLRTSRLLHTSARLSNTRTGGGNDPAVSQGHAASNSNKSTQDVQSQHVREGLAAKSGSQADAATHEGRAQQASKDGLSGNEEGVGMQEQIGGKSAPGKGGVKGGKEEASPPGIVSALKSGLGLGTTSKQPHRSYHSGARRTADKGHTAETYFKDVDETAPPDSKTHSVAYGEEVQRASEPPSGEWSRKGAESKEYETVSKTEPYSPPAPGAQDQKLRYGNREEWASQPGKGVGGTSQPGEGPEGASAGGRKPERAS